MLVGMGHPIQTLPLAAAALREVDIVGVFRYANTYAESIESDEVGTGPYGAGNSSIHRSCRCGESF